MSGRRRRAGFGPSGLLVVDKPAGPTSHDVVDAVRRLLGTRRVGHAGTLDPPATGVLLVLVGAATRLSPYLTGLEKEYAAVVRFGRATTTDDATGEVVAEGPVRFEAADLERALAAFRGEIRQRPPAVSAVRVRGERSWRRALRGEKEPPPERTVRIRVLELLDFRPPDAELRVVCSSGTYVRSLARDLGAALQTPAHLLSLRRSRVGTFGEGQAAPLAELEEGGPEEVLSRLLPPAAALAHLPSRTLGEDEERSVRHGAPIVTEEEPSDVAPAATRHGIPEGALVRLLDREGRLVAVAERRGDVLRPRTVLAPLQGGDR